MVIINKMRAFLSTDGGYSNSMDAKWKEEKQNILDNDRRAEQ